MRREERNAAKARSVEGGAVRAERREERRDEKRAATTGATAEDAPRRAAMRLYFNDVSWISLILMIFGRVLYRIFRKIFNFWSVPSVSL